MIKSVKQKCITHSLYSVIELKAYFVLSTLIIVIYAEIYSLYSCPIDRNRPMVKNSLF